MATKTPPEIVLIQTIKSDDASVKRSRRLALSVLLVLTFIAVAAVARTVWVGLLGGLVMAFSAEPLYRRLAPKLGHRRSLAAGLTTLCGGLLMVLAAGLALWVIARELLVVVDLFRAKATAITLEELLGPGLVRFVDALHIPHTTLITRLKSGLSEASGYAASGAGVILETTTSAIVSLILSLFTMYYVLLDWPSLSGRLERLLPLDPTHTRALTRELRRVGRSAFIGTMGTALVQGLLAGIGFAIAGVPEPAIWGAVTILASFLPVVGTAMVWAGVAFAQLAAGHTGSAVFVSLWGALVVMAVADYVVRPRLVGSGGQMHPLLLLVALIGGVHVFGLAGVIVGPLVVSLFLAMVVIYEREGAGALSGD